MIVAGAWRVLGAALLLAAMLVAAPAGADSPRGAEHDGFGRLVFAWPSPTRLETDAEGARLRLRFSRPLPGDPGVLLGALPRYLNDLSLSEDRRQLTLLLARPLRARTFQMGADWVVDLVEAPTPAAERAPSPPALRVRTGEHGSFHRLVFDWPEPVPYEVDAAEGRAVIRFGPAASLDAAALRRRLPDDIALRAVDSDDGLRVALDLPEAARLRHFRSDGKVVVDVIRAGEAPPRPRPDVAEAGDGGEAPPPPVKPQAPAPQPEATAAVAPVPDPPLERLPAEARHPLAPLDPLSKARLRPPSQPGRAPNFVVAQGSATGGGGAEAETGAETAPDDGGVAAAPAAERPAVVDVPSPPPPPNRLAALSFDWETPVAAAVFRRAGWLWIVFDAEQEVDLPAIEDAGGGEVVSFVEQLPYDGLTVLRLITAPGVNPTVRRDGLAWLVDLAVQPHRPTTPIDVIPATDGPSPPHLMLAVPEGGPRLRILDPEVGDELLVVPVLPVGYGVHPAHDYPEFRLLATAQGVVMRPRAAGLEVTSAHEGIDIARPDGLAISTEAAAAVSGVEAASPVAEILDLAAWARLGAGDLNAARRALQSAVADSPAHRRNQARLDLARFLVANGLGAEALGVLQRMAAFAPDALQQPWFRVVRGIANMLMGRYAQAAADLEATAPYSGGELAIWQAAAAAAQGAPDAQLAPLVQGVSTLRHYPPVVKLRLAWLVADAAIAAGDADALRSALDLAAAEALDRHQAMWLSYLEGTHARLAGDVDEAIRIWREVEAGDNRKARAHAARDRIELELSLDRIGPEEAVAALEGLRFAWRDEGFEYGLLKRIGRMQIDTGSYSDGLRTLKSLVSSYPDHAGNEAVTEMMRRTYTDVFLGERGDNLDPVTAIALFNEFRELTPTGPRGDEMIRRLADRLVSVDLLRPAAELLRHQVEFRLAGAEKARVAARLALVLVLDGQPEEALAVLDDSRVDGLPAGLTQQRRHLRARALRALGRHGRALALLEGDDSYEGRLLRAELHWAQEDWPRAARALATLVRAPAAGEALADLDARMVLHWASALTLAGDDAAVRRLRRRFEAAMAAGPYAEAFDLVTAAIDSQPLDIASIDDKIRQAESFQAFLGEYRQRLADEGLSAMN